MNGNPGKQGVKRNVYKHIATWAGEMALWLRTVMIFTFRSALSSQVVGKHGRWDILVAGVQAATLWMSSSVSIITKSQTHPTTIDWKSPSLWTFKQGLKHGRTLQTEALLHSVWRWLGHRLNTKCNLQPTAEWLPQFSSTWPLPQLRQVHSLVILGMCEKKHSLCQASRFQPCGHGDGISNHGVTLKAYPSWHILWVLQKQFKARSLLQCVTEGSIPSLVTGHPPEGSLESPTESGEERVSTWCFHLW